LHNFKIILENYPELFMGGLVAFNSISVPTFSFPKEQPYFPPKLISGKY